VVIGSGWWVRSESLSGPPGASPDLTRYRVRHIALRQGGRTRGSGPGWRKVNLDESSADHPGRQGSGVGLQNVGNPAVRPCFWERPAAQVAPEPHVSTLVPGSLLEQSAL
jgi:hypothetical protein